MIEVAASTFPATSSASAWNRARLSMFRSMSGIRLLLLGEGGVDALNECRASRRAHLRGAQHPVTRIRQKPAHPRLPLYSLGGLAVEGGVTEKGRLTEILGGRFGGVRMFSQPRREVRGRGIGIGHGFTLRFRSEEHTSELQSLMRISYAVF